jgi:hypothetical protein
LRRWPLWLNQLRQSVYQLLERACYHKVRAVRLRPDGEGRT